MLYTYAVFFSPPLLWLPYQAVSQDPGRFFLSPVEVLGQNESTEARVEERRELRTHLPSQLLRFDMNS